MMLLFILFFAMYFCWDVKHQHNRPDPVLFGYFDYPPLSEVWNQTELEAFIRKSGGFDGTRITLSTADLTLLDGNNF